MGYQALIYYDIASPHELNSLLRILVSLPAGVAAQSSIYDTAVAANLTTLVALVNQAGLASTLQGPGTFTVFAPTDAAFALIPPPLVNWLTNSRTLNAATLQSTLLLHVLGTQVYSYNVSAPK